MYDRAQAIYAAELAAIREAGLYKDERVITTPQGARIASNGKQVLNFCANNYLGLAKPPARSSPPPRRALDTHGFGMSSVRFICGTQSCTSNWRSGISRFFGTEDTILYSSCFDANGGLFETLLGARTTPSSAMRSTTPASSTAFACARPALSLQQLRLADLEAKLKQAPGARTRMIATDGVFSMDGFIAPLDAICDLAEKYDALVMVDDSHATGFLGATGRGTP
jgi:glycine C-acetyltransferase